MPAKYPTIKIVRNTKEQAEPKLILTRVITAMNENPKVDQADIKALMNRTYRFDHHTTPDEWESEYSKYVTLQKKRGS